VFIENRRVVIFFFIVRLHENVEREEVAGRGWMDGSSSLIVGRCNKESF
jgi:hypothetical protein